MYFFEDSLNELCICSNSERSILLKVGDCDGTLLEHFWDTCGGTLLMGHFWRDTFGGALLGQLWDTAGKNSFSPSHFVITRMVVVCITSTLIKFTCFVRVALAYFFCMLCVLCQCILCVCNLRVI